MQKNQVTRPRLEKNFPRNPPKYKKFKKRIKKQQNEHNKNIITFFFGVVKLEARVFPIEKQNVFRRRITIMKNKKVYF